MTARDESLVNPGKRNDEGIRSGNNKSNLSDNMDILKLARNRSTFLEFSIHEKTGDILVKVINTETNEVIREIPPEKILDIVAALWDITGIAIDEKV